MSFKMPTLKQMLSDQQKKTKAEEKQKERAGQLLEELSADAEGVRHADPLKAEAAGRKDWSDGEYWFAVAFESREQKLAVLAALGLPIHEDKYISGTDFIRALKLSVPLIQRKRHRLKENKVWAEFVDNGD